jgi:hypothetical protein
MFDSISLINNKLEVAFGVNCEKKEFVDILFWSYPQELIADNIFFNHFYNLYVKYCYSVNKECLHFKLCYNLLVINIGRLKYLYKKKERGLLIDLNQNILNLSKELPIFIKFPYGDFYLWYFLIKCRMWWVLDKMLKVYYKIKK